jgi:hypothetical protein
MEAFLEAFYKRHNPTKVGDVPELVKKFKGREDELLESLEAKYGFHAKATDV